MQSKSNLETLRNELRKYHGSMNEVAKKSGATRQWVNQVLHGIANNDHIINTALEVLRERKKNQELKDFDFKQKLDKLMNK